MWAEKRAMGTNQKVYLQVPYFSGEDLDKGFKKLPRHSVGERLAL